MQEVVNNSFNWKCLQTWKQSAYNTMWCLIGCSIGDFGTIIFFQVNNYNWSTLAIMSLAIINGIITSICLESIILIRKMNVFNAIKTAMGMSFVSMISMEVVMNFVDYILMGKATINIYIVPLMLLAGFITPWPYNYWSLKKYGRQCH